MRNFSQIEPRFRGTEFFNTIGGTAVSAGSGEFFRFAEFADVPQLGDIADLRVIVSP